MMDLKGMNFELSVEQETERNDLVEALRTNRTINTFMERYNCPFEIISTNAYRFKRWLEDLSRVSNLSKDELSNNPELGAYINLYFDKDTGVLMDEYVRSRGTLEIYESRKHYERFLLFPLSLSLKEASFESIRIDRESGNYLKIMNELTSFCTDNERGYYLFGDLGVGKSYLAACTANLMAKQGKSIVFVSPSNLLSHIRNSFSVSYEQERIMRALKTADLLVLDDLGAEPISAWGRDEIMLPVLNDRLENKRKTIMTSNYRPEMLETLYSLDNRGNLDVLRSKRFVDRILAMTKQYEIVGENRRKQ